MEKRVKTWQKLMADFNKKHTTSVTDTKIKELSNRFDKIIRNIVNGGEWSFALAIMQRNLATLIEDFMCKLDKLMIKRKNLSDKWGILDITLKLSNILLDATAHCPPGLHIQIVDAGIAGHISQNLFQYRELYREALSVNEKTMSDILSFYITSGLGALDNCARTHAVRSKLREQITQDVYYFVDSRDNFLDHVLTSIAILERIYSNNDIHKQLFPEEFLSKAADMFRTVRFGESQQMHCVDYPNSNFTFEVDTYLMCLMRFAKQEDYRCCFLRQLENCQTTLEKILREGTDLEVERLKSLLQMLVEHSCSRCNPAFAITLMAKHGVYIPRPSVMAYGGVKLEVGTSGSPADSQGCCPYMYQCKKFLISLNVTEVYLDKAFHRCFCESCFSSRGDVEIYSRGKPEKNYALPKGWVKFSLKVGPRATAMAIWDVWHVAFHGTKTEYVEKILRTDDLLMPDDITPDGLKLSPPTGHFTETTRPDGFDIKQVFVTPSIKYGSLPVFAPQTRFEDPDTKETFHGSVAFQVRIKPDSYKVGRETVGASARRVTLDEHFPNSELEWSTNHRGVIILVGILVKLATQAEV